MRRASPTRRMPTRRNEDGNIIVALMVLIVTTTLIVALMNTTINGLHTSRRASGSANALQAADAGINDAAKMIDFHTCSSPPCASFTGGATVGPGSYSYTATWTNTNEWQVVSVGTDTATQTQRKVIADATAAPLFGNAFFAVAGATLKGTADSYTGPTNTCDSSADAAAGIIGSDGGISLTQSAGSSSYNCRQYVTGYQYAADGCVFYGQPSVPASYVGTGMCPPAPASTATNTPFQPPAVTVPSSPASEGDVTCSTAGGITAGTHVYNNLTLSNGCSVAGAAVLYVRGNVTIGTDTGNCRSFVNPPAGATCTSSGNNSIPVWPSNWYATGWPAELLIKVAGSGTVSFANHAEFWGIVDAPNGTVSATGSGTPQVTVFGAVVAHSASAAAQFQFHYDESLEQIQTTGEYQVSDWREVPLTASY